MRTALVLLPCLASLALAQTPGEQAAADYFRSRTTSILAVRGLHGVHTLGDWERRRETHRREIREMLGLDPMPPRTDLRVTTAGTLDGGRFTVEKLSFQSMPGLYVTANLYVPKQRSGRLPAILYVCGHGRSEK